MAVIRQIYINFIENFEGLNPYELDHLSRAIHAEYKAAKNKKSLTKKDVKDILVRAMQDVQIEFAEMRLEEAQIHLSMVKSRLFKR